MRLGTDISSPDDPDGFIGFAVWSEFGFETIIYPAEPNAVPAEALRVGETVQDMIATDPDCWEKHGRGRDMRFDLTALSCSGTYLPNYQCDVLSLPEIKP